MLKFEALLFNFFGYARKLAIMAMVHTTSQIDGQCGRLRYGYRRDLMKAIGRVEDLSIQECIKMLISNLATVEKKSLHDNLLTFVTIQSIF